MNMASVPFLNTKERMGVGMLLPRMSYIIGGKDMVRSKSKGLNSRANRKVNLGSGLQTTTELLSAQSGLCSFPMEMCPARWSCRQETGIETEMGLSASTMPPSALKMGGSPASLPRRVFRITLHLVIDCRYFEYVPRPKYTFSGDSFDSLDFGDFSFTVRNYSKKIMCTLSFME